MAKLGFDIDSYRDDAVRRLERAQDVEIKRESNRIAANQTQINKKALWISGLSLLISVLAFIFSAIHHS